MEIGTICETDGLIFAYRGETPEYILHYACVFRDNTVRIYKYGGTGKVFNKGFREAEPHEIRRFNDALHENGFKWNVTNCVITNVTTSEILEQ